MEKLKERKWKVLESTYLHRKPWLTVRSERVELPNGNQIPEYFVFEYPEWINVIAITKDKKFVFVSQYRHGLGETSYELCAGVCEKKTALPSFPLNVSSWKKQASAKVPERIYGDLG